MLLLLHRIYRFSRRSLLRFDVPGRGSHAMMNPAPGGVSLMASYFRLWKERLRECIARYRSCGGIDRGG